MSVEQVNVEIQYSGIAVTVTIPGVTLVVGMQPLLAYKGPQGDTGPSGATATAIADQVISGHMGLRWADDGGLVYASSDDDWSYAAAYAGISLNAAQIGADVTYQDFGICQMDGWNWELGPVFIGLDGALTQTPPITGILRLIGYASTPTSIDLRASIAVLRG